MLSRSRDWVAEKLAGEQAAAAASWKESDLHKKLGLRSSTPTNGCLIRFVHPTANIYGCWPHWNSQLGAEKKNEKSRFLLRK